MADSLKQQIGDRAAQISKALADATEKIGRPRPDMVKVGQWELLALTDNAERRRAADSARKDAESIEQPGRGFDYWHARPGHIKFVVTDDLAAAYRATGDEGYAVALRTLIEDFWESLKPPKYAGGGMRLSMRIGRWAQCLPYFFDSEAFDEAFVQRVIDSVADQLPRILETHKINTRGNIRMLETNGMFWVGNCLPMVEGAGKALERARWVYTDTARRAVYEDGSYREYDPNYHDIFQGTFYNLLLWREAFPELKLPDVNEAAAKVFDYAVGTKSPIGHSAGMQESPSPWIGSGDLSRLLQKRSEVRKLAGLPDDPPPLVHACMTASQVMMRTGWEREAMFAAFDASRWGGAHSHLARNSVLLYKYGRALLADTGSLTYAMDQKAHEGDELDHKVGPYGKSTRAHNTLNLNGWNQAPTNPDSLMVYPGENATAVASTYSGGYWPGSYGWYFHGFGAGVHAEHTRMLFWIPDRFIAVVDHFIRWDDRGIGHEEQINPSLEMNWQLSPGGEITLAPDHSGFTAVYREGGLLGHFARLAPGMTLSLHEGETDPPRGFATTRTKAKHDLMQYGVFDQPSLSQWKKRSYVPSPQVSATTPTMEGYGQCLASVFVPFEGGEAPKLSTRLDGQITAEHPHSMAGRLIVDWGDGAQDTLQWTDRLMQEPLIEAADDHGKFMTDGCFLHIRRDAGQQIVGGAALDATYLTDRDGQTLPCEISTRVLGY
ncbi:MAG: heparinase II/III family protein [Phycisphaeraceae bacterium]